MLYSDLPGPKTVKPFKHQPKRVLGTVMGILPQIILITPNIKKPTILLYRYFGLCGQVKDYGIRLQKTLTL